MNHATLTLLAVVLLLGAGFTCQPTPETTYDFPYKTQIEDVDKDHCLDGFGGRVIDVGSKLEDGLYNLVGSKVSLEQQVEVGDAFHEELMQKATLVENERTFMLEDMLAAMKPFVYRKDIDYKVYLLEDSVLNAWTVPGGNIYFTTRLLDFVESEDELAAIMGHEIGHNENHHTERYLKRLGLAENVFGRGGTVVANVLSLLTVSYNQPQELESDRAGVYLAYMAGYNPERGVDFFRRIEAESSQERNGVARFISSHPFPEEREACLQAYLDNSRVK